MDQDRLGTAGSRGAVGQRQGRRRRGTALVAAGASLVLAAGVAVAGVRLADRPQPFGENDAVAAFRAAQAPPGAPEIGRAHV